MQQVNEKKTCENDRIKDAQRGLVEGDRKAKDIIDKYINGARQAIRTTHGKISKYQKKKLDPPDSLWAELEARFRKLHLYTVARIRRMVNYSEKEVKWIMKQCEGMQAYLDPDIADPLVQDIHDRLVKKLKHNLAWKMEKLRNNDHPFWQKEALKSLEILSQLGENVDAESFEFIKIMDAYKRKERDRKSKLLGPGGLEEESEYLQKCSADDLHNREKGRATANRMS